MIEGYRGAHDVQRLVDRLVEEDSAEGGHGDLVAILLSRDSLIPEEKRIDEPRLLLLRSGARAAVDAGGPALSRSIQVSTLTLEEWIARPRDERLAWLPLHAIIAFVERVSAL